MKTILVASLALVLPVFALPVFSQSVYKCTNPEGKVVYQTSSCSGTGMGAGGRVSLKDNGKVNGANDPLPSDLQANVQRLEQAQEERRQAAADHQSAREALAAQSAPSPDQERRNQEAQRILNNLPSGKPGDKAKRDSMLEHARILMNAGDGPGAEQAEKVLNNMPYGKPGDKSKRESELERARILTGQSTGAPPERTAPSSSPPPIPAPSHPTSVTVRSRSGDSSGDHQGWRDPHTGQVKLNNSQNPGMPLRGTIDNAGNGQVKDIYGNTQQVRGGKIVQ